MSDTLIFARTAVRAPLPSERPLESPTAPLRGRSFAATLHAIQAQEVSAQREPAPVVEVLEAVETDFRQGEASMLGVINAALAGDGMTRPQLLNLRARMRRYSHEVNALANLVQALVRDIKARDRLGADQAA
jgi:hypothetical protein